MRNSLKTLDLMFGMIIVTGGRDYSILQEFEEVRNFKCGGKCAQERI
jgi:hypothetical protein